MKVRIKADNIVFLLILILFSVVTIVDSLSLPGYSGLLPFCTGMAILVFAAILIGMGLSSRFSRVLAVYVGLTIQFGKPVDSEGEGQDEILLWGRVFICWGWMVGFFVLILLAGYFIAVPLFTFALLWLFCRRKVLSSVAATLIIWGFVYFISTVLNMELFRGVIFGGILPLL
jgi:hypothetical protein